MRIDLYLFFTLRGNVHHFLRANLTCPKGHDHYAPNPAYWVGRDCGHGEGRTVAGTIPIRGRCRELLTAIRTTA